MSNTIGQKDAVVNAVANILGDDFTANSTNVKDIITAEQLNAVRQEVLDGILDGSVEYNKSTDNTKAVERYVNGMVDNHFRKAKELNGGNKYVPKTTGTSRKDLKLKTLNKLLKTFPEGSDKYSKVQEAISEREAELKAEKAAKVEAKKKEKVKAEINTDILPDDLKDIANDITC